MKQKSIIALMTVKGGSGKTTLAACLGAELAKRGHKVTLIDANPQGPLTARHGIGAQMQEIPFISDSSKSEAQKTLEASKTSLVLIETPLALPTEPRSI